MDRDEILQKLREHFPDYLPTGYTPTRLLAFLPRACLDEGVKPGGWAEPVVPAFDPVQKSIDSMAESFNEEGDRVLVEYAREYAAKFQPRCTGPQNKPQGIYIYDDTIPASALKVLYDPEGDE